MTDYSPIPLDDEPVKLEPDDEAPVQLVSDDEISNSITYEDETPISLVSDNETSGEIAIKHKNQIKDKDQQQKMKRPLNSNNTGATRCRIFHSKLSSSSLEGVENQINEWIDSNQDIEIKQVGHVIGKLQGKSTDENLIVMCWY